MKQAGVVCCTYFASRKKNEDYIFGGGKKPRPLGVLQFLPVGEMCLFEHDIE